MASWREFARSTWHGLRGWPAWFLLVWLLAMLTMPITNWIWGERILYLHISFSVLIQACLSTALFARGQGIPRTVLTVVIVFVLSWALEAVGSATGIPFGHYHYTDRLQPQVAHVPLLIPLAWLMMFPAAWVVAYRIVGRWEGIQFVIVSALAMTYCAWFVSWYSSTIKYW